MKDYYDVIIIGASIAGMEAALNLKDSNLNILIIERSKVIGSKTCAHGITSDDIPYLPPELINFPLQKLHIHYSDKTITFPDEGGIISSIDRQKYLQYRYDQLKKYKNIDFLLGTSPQNFSQNFLTVCDKKIEFKYLIGADGSVSAVRRFLKLKSQKISFGVQYITTQKFSKFELFFDDKLFGTGYAWIFPNKNFTSIGCGSDISALPIKQLTENFHCWLKSMNVDVSDGKFQAALLNNDYQGFKFKNIYLVGDAAGLIQPFTGKGMQAAMASAKYAAKDIMGENPDQKIIDRLVKKNQNQEKILKLLKNYIKRKIILKLIMQPLFFRYFKEKILSNV